MRFLVHLAFILGFSLCAFSAQAGSMRAIETRGVLSDADNGRIAANVWDGMSRSDVLLLIDSLPVRYASPTYYEIARRLLLSDAPMLPADVKAKGEAPETNPDRPDVLIARLDKLLEMGALRDAETLYDTVVGDVPSDFDLTLRSLQILMLRGQLSAACLDLQAMSPQHGANPKWKELNRLCRIQFAAGGERERLIKEAKFEEFPSLALFLRGRLPAKLSTLSISDLAFAVATGQVSEATLRQYTPRGGKLPPLLLAVLYQMDTEDAIPEKTCLAIEAARRGMATTRELIILYEKPHYPSDLLLENIASVPSPGSIHPCMVPTVMYQRIASNKTQPARDATIRTALDVMKDLPDAAFWPMALYLKDMDVHAALNKKYLWRATRILGYEKDALPESWAGGWRISGNEIGVSPFWPVQAIVSPSPDSLEELAIWRRQWPSEARRVASRDPLIPVLLGQSLAPEEGKDGKKGKGPDYNYENILPLTFSRSYAMPSYGLTQRLADVIEKKQTGQSVALLLIGYGAIPPDQVIPHQMALVIDGLNKANLGRYARRFALEVLR